MHGRKWTSSLDGFNKPTVQKQVAIQCILKEAGASHIQGRGSGSCGQVPDVPTSLWHGEKAWETNGWKVLDVGKLLSQDYRDENVRVGERWR